MTYKKYENKKNDEHERHQKQLLDVKFSKKQMQLAALKAQQEKLISPDANKGQKQRGTGDQDVGDIAL